MKCQFFQHLMLKLRLGTEGLGIIQPPGWWSKYSLDPTSGKPHNTHNEVKSKIFHKRPQRCTYKKKGHSGVNSEESLAASKLFFFLTMFEFQHTGKYPPWLFIPPRDNPGWRLCFTICIKSSRPLLCGHHISVNLLRNAGESCKKSQKQNNRAIQFTLHHIT